MTVSRLSWLKYVLSTNGSELSLLMNIAKQAD